MDQGKQHQPTHCDAEALTSPTDDAAPCVSASLTPVALMLAAPSNAARGSTPREDVDVDGQSSAVGHSNSAMPVPPRQGTALARRQSSPLPERRLSPGTRAPGSVGPRGPIPLTEEYNGSYELVKPEPTASGNGRRRAAMGR